MLSEIKWGLIAPTLEKIGLYSDTALNLVTGTGLVESGYRVTIQSGGGPALGWFQMEPATHDDIWRNYLVYRKALSQKILSLLPEDFSLHQLTPHPSSSLLTYPPYAVAMCRVKYLRSSLPLPENNAVALCKYWKQVYNTPLGKGKVDDAHISLFQEAIDAQATSMEA